MDSGASIRLKGLQNLTEEERKKVKKAGHKLRIKPAKGLTEAYSQICIHVPELGVETQPCILEHYPDVLSMGKCCAEQGFGFYEDPWSLEPRLVRPDGKIIICGCPPGGVPVIPAEA